MNPPSTVRQEIEELFDSKCQYTDEAWEANHLRPDHKFEEQYFCQDCFMRDLSALIEREKRAAAEEAFVKYSEEIDISKDLYDRVISEMFPSE